MTDWKPVTTTVNQPRYSTVMRPVTTTTLVSQPYTVNRPVTTTRLVTETVEGPIASGQSEVQASPQAVGPRTVTREVAETHNVGHHGLSPGPGPEHHLRARDEGRDGTDPGHPMAPEQRTEMVPF